MNKPNISIQEYTYQLPPEKIAKYPLKNREDSKLLIYKNNNIEENQFHNLHKYIPSNSLIVFNNTKVIQARIQFQKTTGANIEVFCLEPINPSDLNLVFQTKQSCSWKCIVGNSKKWKNGPLTKSITINNQEITITIEREEILDDAQIINFSWDNNSFTFAEILENIGNIPIPPYLNRDTEEIDLSRYQTVYSNHKGSVAAPTAGLHFTENVIDKLNRNNIDITNVTLHVGAGTFKPVKSEKISDHEMHIEHFFVEEKTIDLLLKFEDNITSTGTTTVRTLESLYWLGVKQLENINEFYISQWDPYNLPGHHSTKNALLALKKYLQNKGTSVLQSSTGIMIAPGYSFKVVNRLITNFHQPNSTLLLLIAAFTSGDNWKEIYNYALNNDFRFLSYGDSSLLFR
ncbi:S-adenosylmethionine:tRNA ribosyltransferase-isomerase [Plebeiibacterium sediminum]|uniref:S-adenosylmethionine:tRNA ribosyltransferase-isomerase n=1 Tax=Plebeiibacterium sediminum TaxID=2992112 RepID=A0AAE3M570_9BACT|nr:S-adenosylmethionine:tRNA ribosyltransferase-isomerase [Plebeiobacterium sediminum]MCW3787040.1 S-adenosylmethionine:tRNA ribosyltransferase-isomerase [Plebeiobacterium sediminum]